MLFDSKLCNSVSLMNVKYLYLQIKKIIMPINLLAKVAKWLYLKVEYIGCYSSGIIRYV